MFIEKKKILKSLQKSSMKKMSHTKKRNKKKVKRSKRVWIKIKEQKNLLTKMTPKIKKKIQNNPKKSMMKRIS